MCYSQHTCQLMSLQGRVNLLLWATPEPALGPQLGFCVYKHSFFALLRKTWMMQCLHGSRGPGSRLGLKRSRKEAADGPAVCAPAGRTMEEAEKPTGRCPLAEPVGCRGFDLSGKRVGWGPRQGMPCVTEQMPLVYSSSNSGQSGQVE